MVLQCINIRQVPWEVLKSLAFGLGFQHLPRDLANVKAWKTMFDPYINILLFNFLTFTWLSQLWITHWQTLIQDDKVNTV